MDSIQGKKNDVLIATDGGNNVILDTDVTLYVGGNYLIGDSLYRVVAIDQMKNVYIKSI